jgi:hypothetical protein
MESDTPRFVFRVHALQRMFRRRISVQDVREVVLGGETLETYRDDQPYPSRLVLGWRSNRPLHVVVADDQEESQVVVITAYEPDPDRWSGDFRRRMP